MQRILGPFIDGELTASGSDSVIEVVNPSNGQNILTIPAGCYADADRAIASARTAFDDGRWGDTPPSFKKKTLHKFANLVAEKSSDFDAMDAAEMGKPISVSRGNALSAADLMRFYAESVDKVAGDVFVSDKSSVVIQRRVPRGVVAAVVPWNFPTYNAVLKFAPALSAGNCVVLKPSELSSRSAMLLAKLALDAGVPSGVLNVVPGLGTTVGQAMGLHRDVDMMTFTGSSDVGKQMLMYAAQSNMKTVLAECGGKSPHIVFDDGVDLEEVSAFVAKMLLTNQGQVCSVGSRLLVHRSIEGYLLEKIVAQLGGIIMGDASDPSTTFGPVASERQLIRVLKYIDGAKVDGALLVSGGARALTTSGGFFVEPTVIRNVLPSARVAQDEIFGPVLSVIPFESETEAIHIANSTQYGMTAYVWTASMSTGMRMSKAIRSTVRVNAVAPKGEGAGHATSFEPAGQSGIGPEGGLAGMESYLRRQLVWINHA